MNDQQLNAYYCPECQEYIVTVDRDEGTTPMFLACRVKGDSRDSANDCRGLSQSMGYPSLDSWPIDPTPTWEWFRPSAEEIAAMDDDMRDHIERGGLALRKIEALA